MQESTYLVPLLSTQHVSQEDYEWFENAKSAEALVFLPNEVDDGYGLIVYVDSAWYTEDYPEGVKQLFSWASRKGYHFVRLTPDGGTIDDLPTYDW